MKNLLYAAGVCALALSASCSNNDEPEDTLFLQPSAITTCDAEGNDQSFEYDDSGRIVYWSSVSNDPAYGLTYTARYSYPDNSTVHVVAEDLWEGNKRCYDETIQLANGRALKSEGTFISYVDGHMELRKTYHLEYEYDPSNHLTIVKHSEVVGIGDDINEGAWNKPWAWENHLIWENGNLKEYQNYSGNSSVYETTRYDYSNEAVDYPVIMPVVINNAHHLPLFMQGVFGLNSVNLVKSSTITDNRGNITFVRRYTYEIDQARIIGYTETNSGNAAHSAPITYKVTWTER